MSATKEPLRVCITGAAGQIGYALYPLFANGLVLGADQPIILHLLDIEPAKKALEGLVMEINDGAYPLVHDIVATTDLKEAFTDVDCVVLVGGFPRKAGMMRADLLAKNGPIFVAQGKAISDYAKKTCKTLVVANPANTNALVAATNAANIPKENFTALTRLDVNRAHSQLAAKCGTVAGNVANAIVWGNHSASLYADATSRATVNGKSVLESGAEREWLEGEFQTKVQKRGAEVIGARGLSSAASAANAAKDHMRAWMCGTAPGEIVSMGVWSNGNDQGVADGLIYSFPVTCAAGGTWSFVKGVELDAFGKAALKKNEEELVGEREVALAKKE